MAPTNTNSPKKISTESLTPHSSTEGQQEVPVEDEADELINTSHFLGGLAPINSQNSSKDDDVTKNDDSSLENTAHYDIEAPQLKRTATEEAIALLSGEFTLASFADDENDNDRIPSTSIKTEAADVASKEFSLHVESLQHPTEPEITTVDPSAATPKVNHKKHHDTMTTTSTFADGFSSSVSMRQEALSLHPTPDFYDDQPSDEFKYGSSSPQEVYAFTTEKTLAMENLSLDHVANRELYDDASENSHEFLGPSTRKSQLLQTHELSAEYSSEILRTNAQHVRSDHEGTGMDSNRTKRSVSINSTKRRSSDQNHSKINKLQFGSLGIHGRVTELDIVDECWDEVADGVVARQLLLISGCSGSGKSSLAESVRIKTNNNNGIYARGKFDLDNRNQPYSAISTACGEICGCLMTLMKSKPHKVEEICLQIQKELGSDLSLLTQIIPSLDEIIDLERCNENGAQPKDISISMTANTEETYTYHNHKTFGIDAEANRNQFNYAFQRFLRVVTESFCPLVIILDDLQWSDGASLDLLHSSLTDPQNSKLFIIGIYRSDEVDDTQMFYQSLDELEAKSEQHEFDLACMEIEDLEVDAVQSIIKELLCTNDRDQTYELAHTCIRKTGGNVFFLLEYLKMLEEKDLIKYNSDGPCWKWDLDQIEFNADASNTGVGLLKARISMLPPEHLYTLKLAACLGSTFDLRTLSIPWMDSLSKSSEHAALKDPDMRGLYEALGQLEKLGLIKMASSSSEKKYTWVHDKIHEASLSMIPFCERSAFAREVGEGLLRQLKDGEMEANIFVVVNLLNLAEDWENIEDCVKLAHLNLAASHKAMSLSAFGSAAEYAGFGIDLLPNNPWTEQYELALQLYSIAAKAESFIGSGETIEPYCKIIFSLEDRPIEDKLDAYNTWVTFLMNEGRVNEALDVMLEILKKFRCRFPKHPAVQGYGIIRGMKGIKASLKSLERVKLSKMTDKRKIEMMKLMSKLFGILFVLQDQRMLLVIFRQLQWILKFGYSDNAPVVLATLSVISAGVNNDMHCALGYGEQALKLLKKSGSLTFASKTYFPLYTMVFPFVKPLPELMKPLMYAYEIGLQNGDTESATWAIFTWLIFNYMLGTSLEKLESDMLKYSLQMRALGRMQTLKMIRVMRQAFVNLMGRDNMGNITRLVGMAVTEHDHKLDKDDEFQVSFTRTTQGLLYTYTGEYVKAAELVYQHGPDYFFRAHVGSPMLVFDSYLKGLSCYAAATQTGKSKYTKMGDFFHGKIKAWHDKGNPNVSNYYKFLEAEAFRARGRFTEAINLYTSVISTASRGGFSHDAALASERLGDLLLKRQDTEEAIYRFNESLKYLKAWGAQGKVEFLQRKHSVVLAQGSEFEPTQQRRIPRGFSIRSLSMMGRSFRGATVDV